MNKARRQALQTIINKIEELKTPLEILRDEEQDTLDNMPESIRDGERGERTESSIQSIEDALAMIDDVIENITEAISA